MNIASRPITPALVGASLVATIALSSTAAFAGHHLEGEGQADPNPPKPRPAKIIRISPADHVMLVGGSRTLNAEICNEDGTKCKLANKGRWSWKPRGIIGLSSRRGAQSTAQGKVAGTARVTVKQGGASGSTTVKINEPPNREPAAEVPELRPRIVPEHPDVREGIPYTLTTLACPAGASIDSSASGFTFIQGETPSILEELLEWKRVGCVDSTIVEVVPDAGFREIYRRGNQVLVIKDEGAEGFGVRIVAEHGGDYPSDKLSFFGSDPDLATLPGLEDVDFEALDEELLDQFDGDGDGVLSVADIDAFRRMQQGLDAEEFDDSDLDREEQDRMEAATDIDGDGDSASTEDELLIVETIGDLVLDRALETTAAEC